MAVILALDIGTTTIIGLLYDTSTKNIIEISECFHDGYILSKDSLKSEIAT
jgi:cell division ATPase FtsA